MGDRVAGRLVARHREQHEEQIELHVGQGVAVDLRTEQRADDVVARVLAALLGQLLRVHEHLHAGVVGLVHRDRVLGILAADHPVAPVEDLVTVLDRDADELGDHEQRELGGHVDDEVAGPLGDRLLEDPERQFADVLLQRVDHARRESTVDELALTAVLRRIHRQHEFGLAEVDVHLLLFEPDDAAAVLVRRVGDRIS